MIKKIALSKLTHNELLTLSSRIMAAIEAIASINTGVIATILGKLKNLYNLFLPILNRNKKGDYRDQLKTKDTNRDDAFRALRDVILGYSRRLNEAYRTAALFLLEIFVRNGWTLYDDNYQEETAELNQLIAELNKEKATASLTTLQLTEMFNEMVTAQNDFEETYQNKVSETSKQDFDAIAEIRPQLTKNLYDLLDRIDLDARYADNADSYTELVATLNTIIAETGTIVKARITRESDDENIPESEEPASVTENETEE